MIKAVIFDFDGTILDTESAEFASWEEIYDAHGCELSRPHYASFVGRGADCDTYDPYGDLEKLLGCPIDREAVRERRRARYADLLDALELLPGVETWLADARRLGLKIGLATSSQQAWTERHLPRYGLTGYFDCIRCANDVTHTKPDPELYFATLKGLGVRAAEVIVVEDSPNGVRAAKAAGLFTVAVPNPITACMTFELADIVVTSLDKLKLEELVERLSAG